MPGKLAACICAPNIQVDFTARSIPRCWVGGEVLGRCWGGAGEVLGRCWGGAGEVLRRYW